MMEFYENSRVVSRISLMLVHGTWWGKVRRVYMCVLFVRVCIGIKDISWPLVSIHRPAGLPYRLSPHTLDTTLSSISCCRCCFFVVRVFRPFFRSICSEYILLDLSKLYYYLQVNLPVYMEYVNWSEVNDILIIKSRSLWLMGGWWIPNRSS